VRQALDMVTGIRFDETYDDPASDISRYGYATGSRLAPPGYDGPRNMVEALPTFQKEGTHGHAFHYVSPNTDVIGWIIGRVTGQPFSRIFSERVWSQLGMERDAYISRDPIGMEQTGGGFNATARDLARFGQMLLQDGAANGRQVIDPAVVAGIRAGGDLDAFARGTEDYGPLSRGWSYRSFWWHTHNAHAAFTGVGIHGQYLYIDPAARVVIVQQASYPTPLQPEADNIVLPAFEALARELGSG
jgi:CubicO group peptidase (beta-lactamase class C family)